MLVILAWHEFHPDDIPEAIKLSRKLCEETLKESGCRHYSFAVDNSHPGRFQIAEWWDTEDQLQNHIKTKHVSDYIDGMNKLRFVGNDATQFNISSFGPVQNSRSSN